MLSQKRIAELIQPLKNAVNGEREPSSSSSSTQENTQYKHVPFDWARVMIEEGETPRP